MQNLTNLNLRSNQIGDTGAMHISKLLGLRTLNLSNNKIRTQGARHLSHMQDLGVEIHGTTRTSCHCRCTIFSR